MSLKHKAVLLAAAWFFVLSSLFLEAYGSFLQTNSSLPSSKIDNENPTLSQGFIDTPDRRRSFTMPSFYGQAHASYGMLATFAHAFDRGDLGINVEALMFDEISLFSANPWTAPVHVTVHMDISGKAFGPFVTINAELRADPFKTKTGDTTSVILPDRKFPIAETAKRTYVVDPSLPTFGIFATLKAEVTQDAYTEAGSIAAVISTINIQLPESFSFRSKSGFFRQPHPMAIPVADMPTIPGWIDSAQLRSPRIQATQVARIISTATKIGGQVQSVSSVAGYFRADPFLQVSGPRNYPSSPRRLRVTASSPVSPDHQRHGYVAVLINNALP